MHLAPETCVTSQEHDEIPVSTRWHRAHGRQTRRQRAVQQQLLTPSEEKALVDHVLRLYRNGHPARIKHLRSFAGTLLQRRAGANGLREKRLPGKDWPQAFCKRHPELEAARLKAIDWQRHEKNIRAKIQRWFQIMDEQLNERGVLQENVYNMDETGVLLSDLNAVKVLIARDDKERRRGVGLKRVMITAVECISADGRSLPPLIIFPGKTLRSTWVSHETPDWHYGCSETGYMNSSLNLYWVQHVFDPATRARADGKPRVLIIDGFNTHESLDVLTFCFEHNIILCRQPSHATHKLQPCDVGLFSPLKTAYREQVERLYRNGAGTVNKAHFTLLYSRAREIAMTPRNIRSSWSKAGLYPFNPSKVLDDMQNTPAESHMETAASSVPMQPLLSPSSLRTPTDAISLVALQRRLEERPEAATNISPCVQKLLNAAKQAFAERELLKEENQELTKQNSEKKTRQHVKEKKIGDAKIMSYEDIIEALKLRDRKDAEKGKKKDSSRAPKKGAKRRATELREEGTAASFAEYPVPSTQPHTDGLTQVVDVRPNCEGANATDTIGSNAWLLERSGVVMPWQAPVARMY